MINPNSRSLFTRYWLQIMTYLESRAPTPAFQLLVHAPYFQYVALFMCYGLNDSQPSSLKLFFRDYESN